MVACGAVVHVCGTFRGLFRERECRLLSANNEIGGEFTVEAVLRSLSGATFFRRVLEVVRSVRASPRCRPVRLSRICSASSSNCRCGRTADWDGTDDWGHFRACRRIRGGIGYLLIFRFGMRADSLRIGLTPTFSTLSYERNLV